MLAQEDACQVLARYPADKYRVTTEEVIGALADVCRARPVAALRLLEQLASGDYTMALTLNERRKEDIGRSDFIALGAAVGVRAPAVERALDELSERVDGWIEDVRELPYDEGLLRKLRRAIEHRRSRLTGP